MRILLVEDDPILGDGIATGLRQAGFAVDWPRNAEAAALALDTEHYSAVVLDIGLAGRRSGLQLLNVLTNDLLGSARATTSSIVLTQVSTSNPGVTLDVTDGSVDVARGTALGAHSLLYKI